MKIKIKSKHQKNLDMDLFQLVWDLTAQVPAGRVTTYGAIARALGDIRASRAVGQIEHVNPYPIVVPCHRVVYSDGGLGGFGAPEGVAKKIKLLKKEGVNVKHGNIEDFKNLLFDDFHIVPPRPLEILRAEQLALKSAIQLQDKIALEDVKTIAGVDASYTYDKAYGAIAVLNLKTLEVLETQTAQCNIRFPYIPTYLSYHELPVAIKLLEKMSIKPDIIIFDGNGVLHPLNMGLATHAGVLLDISTLGIAKKQLLGTMAKPEDGLGNISKVMDNDRLIGYSLKPKTAKKNLVFISPGNHLSFESSLHIAQKICTHRVPEPIRVAHNLALASRNKN
jgi:deoxyribonuclease V